MPALRRALAISPRTMDTYPSWLMENLGLRSVADLVRWAVPEGMVG